MATVTKRLAKGTISNTTSQTVYTVPSNTTTIIKALTVCNQSSSALTLSIIIAGVYIVSQHSIKGNDTITIPFLDQIIQTGEAISLQLHTTGSVLGYYISGKEVT